MEILAFLVHGMGRTPLSMALLSRRLRAVGINARCFGYSVTFECFASCHARLRAKIETESAEGPYVLIGHSLGSVLLRSVLPELALLPAACFFLAPPTQVCHLAQRLAGRWLYRVLSGEMGQLLANAEFMVALPVPTVPTTVYAGTRGFRGCMSPFGGAPNDGILKVSETSLSGARRIEVAATHTFIMNHDAVVRDIIAQIQRCTKAAQNSGKEEGT